MRGTDPGVGAAGVAAPVLSRWQRADFFGAAGGVDRRYGMVAWCGCRLVVEGCSMLDDAWRRYEQAWRGLELARRHDPLGVSRWRSSVRFWAHELMLLVRPALRD